MHVGVMEKLNDYYSYFVKEENIGKNISIPAGHGQVLAIHSEV